MAARSNPIVAPCNELSRDGVVDFCEQRFDPVVRGRRIKRDLDLPACYIHLDGLDTVQGANFGLNRSDAAPARNTGNGIRYGLHLVLLESIEIGRTQTALVLLVAAPEHKAHHSKNHHRLTVAVQPTNRHQIHLSEHRE